MGPKEEAAVVQVEPEQKTKSVVEEVKEEEEKQSSWLGLFRGSRSSQPRDDTGGVYLDDIVSDPEKRALYLKPSPAPLEVCVGPTDPLDLSHILRSGMTCLGTLTVSLGMVRACPCLLKQSPFLLHLLVPLPVQRTWQLLSPNIFLTLRSVFVEVLKTSQSHRHSSTVASSPTLSS